MTVEEAWNLYTQRGVIPPEHAGEIATRRKLYREWYDAGQPLC